MPDNFTNANANQPVRTGSGSDRVRGKHDCKGNTINADFAVERLCCSTTRSLPLPVLTRVLPFVLIFGAAFTAACGLSPVATAPARTANQNAKPTTKIVDANRKKILAFGDSLTIGLGLTEKESYPALLQAKLDADGYNYEILNAGVSGDTSAGGLERIDWSLNQPNIEVMILELGANDILRGQSIAQMKTNLREIVRKAKAKNIKVLLCGIQAPGNLGGARGREINEAFASLAKEEKVEYLPSFLEGVVANAKLNQADGIHPNADGAKIVAETVHEAVTPLLAK